MRPLRLVVAVSTSFLLGASSAHAEQPLIPLLTGGELRSQGTFVHTNDEIASDFVYDPPGADNCIGPMCDSHKDLTFHQKADIKWDTSWLVDARYPGVPADPNASPNAIRWAKTLGTWSSHRKVEDYAFPDDQGEGGNETNPEVSTADCDQPLVARMPEGAETPLISATPDAGFYDPSKGERSFLINAFGSTMNAEICGANDTNGFWAIFGLVPAENEQIAWDLGSEPREQSSWERVGKMDVDRPCDPQWTDGTPRDTETQCRYTSTVRATNRLECALCVQDVLYEHHDGGTANWVEVPHEGTWDGNEVRITLQVFNNHTKTLTVPLLMRDKRSKRVLESPAGTENPRTITFPPGAMTKVEFVWRTDGFAWEKGKPDSMRDLQFLTPYGGAQQRIIVRPRPVVLVHGWKSSAAGWSEYPAMLRAVNPLWEGWAVGDGKVAGTMNTDPFSGNDILENARAEHQYIENLRKKVDADHIDLVVHSMGGLISRLYIHQLMPIAKDGRPVARRMVMLGTPNMGSPCADLISSVARGIPTQQLRPGFAATFNRTVLNRKGVPFSILAGDYNIRTCNSEVEGDGVVEVPSAYWQVSDRLENAILHTSMTEDQHLLDTVVKPRIALDPDEAKKLAAASRAARRATAAPAAAQPTATPAAVETFELELSGRRELSEAVPKGATPAFAFLADPDIGAALVDPKGKVVASQKAGSPEASQPIRYLGSKVKTAGVWKLRLSGSGQVAAAAVPAGNPNRLRVALKGRRLIATVSGFTPARVTARLLGRAKPLKLKRRGNTWSVTVPKGTRSAQVTATRGRQKLIATR